MNPRKSKIETRNSFQLSSFAFRISPVILVVVGLLVGCKSKPPAAPVDFFSDRIEGPGWEKHGASRTFEASHLWEYVDGDAEKYIQAGVVKTLTCDYKFNTKTDATVDVYVMGSSSGAKKIYDGESSEGSEKLTIGDASRYAKGSLTFCEGPYFVRIVAYQDAPDLETAMSALAFSVSIHLNEAPPTR
jgi:hypothetical protein